MGAAEYDALVLEDAPRYYWKAEGDGADSGSAGLPCTVSGVTWPGAGLIPGSANCAQTSTTSQFYRTTGDVSIPSGLFTLTYWCSHGMMGSATSWGYYGPGRFNNSPNSLRGGTVIDNGTDTIDGANNDISGSSINNPVSTGDNQPHHIAYVNDVDHTRMHVDGVEVARVPTTAASIAAATRFGLTLYPQSGLAMIPGKFERVAMHYGTALSPARIQQYYKAGGITVAGDAFGATATASDGAPEWLSRDAWASATTMLDGAATVGRAYAATLTVPAGAVSTDLPGFPVRVDLADMPSDWWSWVTTDGSNIRVRSAGVDLPFDLVAIDTTTTTGELFFKADLLTASDNLFTVECVTGATPFAVTDPNGRNAVWSDYEIVFNFSGNDPVNRTGSGQELTLSASTVVRNGRLECDGNGEATVPIVNASTGWTAAATWYKTTRRQDAPLYYTGTGYVSFLLQNGSNVGIYSGGGLWMWAQNSSITLNKWYREVVVHSDTDNFGAVYHSGGNKNSENVGLVTANKLIVGAGNTSQRFIGYINRVVVRNQRMSDAWVAAEYASWETPQSFYTVSGPVVVPGESWTSGVVMLGADPVKVLGTAWAGASAALDGSIAVGIPGAAWGVPAVIPAATVVARVISQAAWATAAAMDDLGFVNLGPMLALEVLDPDLDRAPTAVTVVIVGAPAGAPLDFSIDGTLVYSTTADADGYLGPTSLAVTDDMLAGTHTIAVDSNGARGATATFTLKRDASPWPRVVGTDADPVLVPAAQTPSGIYKWVLQDLLPGGLGSFVMPYNPTTMTSPHFQRTLTPRTTTSVAAPAFHITEAAEEAISWEFSGYLDTQAAHDQLVAFGELNRRFYVIDHRNRAWVVTFTSVELTARKRQSRDDGTFNDWAHDYTVRALIYDQDWKVPQ